MLSIVANYLVEIKDTLFPNLCLFAYKGCFDPTSDEDLP